jgi:murein DD-endopeptidase MepM/ murein hydrolase activator NlpD
MRAPRRTGAAAAAAVLLGVLGVVAAASGSGTAGHARAVVFSTPAGSQGVVERTGAGTSQARALGAGAVRGSGSAAAAVAAGTARASIDADEVSVFGGLVTAAEVSIHAAATRQGAPAYSGFVHDLVAAGRPLGSPGRAITHRVGSYGTVSVLGPGAGLVVRLSRAYHGYAAGSTVTVGLLDVSAPAPPPRRAPAPRPAPRPRARRAAAPTAPPRRAAHHARPAPRPRARPRVHRRRAPAVHPGLTGRGYAFPVFSRQAAVADNFGAPREIGAHQGDDIFAPFGTPVVAVHAGTVHKVGTLDISGNRLWVYTPGGAAFFYCHLSAFAPAAVDGAHVKAGTVLGFVGNTGDAEPTPPHLHFEIHPGGEAAPAVDPFAILTAWQRRQDVPSDSWLADTAPRPGTLVQVRDFLAGL